MIKRYGAIVLFGVQPFTTDLIISNRKWFKYTWVWVKTKPNGWQHAKNKPMQTTEDIAVFSEASIGHQSLLGDKRMVYSPQGVISIGQKVVTPVAHGRMMGARPNQVGKQYEAYKGFPSNVLHFANVVGESAIHPTQKPVALMEYLIKTYTNPGDLVLDNTFGSCSTGEACLNTGRRFIGIEKDPEYFRIGQERMERVEQELREAQIARERQPYLLKEAV